MRYSSQVKPISYLKANAAEVLANLSEQREPLVITQNGEAKAVLQDVASFASCNSLQRHDLIIAAFNRAAVLECVKGVSE